MLPAIIFQIAEEERKATTTTSKAAERKDNEEVSGELKLKQQLETATSGLIAKYEAQINEMKNQHYQRVQERECLLLVIGASCPCLINSLSVLSVERNYRISMNNARNKSETEIKWKTNQFERDLESARKAHQRELEESKRKFDAVLATREKEHKKVILDYEAKDKAWQLEKQVR